MVNIIPAMPGKVNVEPSKDSAPAIKTMLVDKAILAIVPNLRPYDNHINKPTPIRPIIEAILPAFIES